MGGRDGESVGLSSVESYDPELNVWSFVADRSSPRHGVGVGVLDGVLYCVGGHGDDEDGETLKGCGKTVEKYNVDTNTWSQVAEMNHSRFWPGVIAHAGRLYAIGGSGETMFDNDPLSSVEMYDPVTNTWTLVADMSVGREGPAVALIHRPRTY